MNREEMVARVQRRDTPWDIVIIGGGAVGAGVAVDASTRGFEVLLVEREDFGKGTSSRSTKLVHGGVRYLEQGNISLVMEALKERGLLLRNAPHIVHDLPFVVPNYSWWEAPFYGIGMKVYDLLAGKYNFGRSKVLSLEETLERLPTIQRSGLRGGVLYHDGQFDDTRLLTHLLATAVDHGATVVNYAEVVSTRKDVEGFLSGVEIHDRESNRKYTVGAKVVVNATGIFTDATRRLAQPDVKAMVTPAQGIHLVLDRSFLRGENAIMVPRTSDGRVLFAIPWHDRTLVGTTDTAIEHPSYEPLALEEEIEFVLDTAAEYLSRPPSRSDVLSIFVGIRPLVSAPGGGEGKTSALSRGHTIHIDESGLMTVVGGKWTTYRHMAEDCVDHAITLGSLRDTPCVTADLPIHGYHRQAEKLGSLSIYGTDAEGIKRVALERPELAEKLHPDLPYIAAEIVWSVRNEMSRTLDDALARRTRALLLNARATIEVAPKVAKLMAAELERNDEWIQGQIEGFTTLAKQYILGPAPDRGTPLMRGALFGEFAGTFIMMLLGDGVVAACLLKGTKASGSGWMVICTAWGFAVICGIFTANLFGSPAAHLNPAITVAAAVSSGEWSNVLPFACAQISGSFLAAVVVWLFYLPHWGITEDQGAKLGIFCTAPAIRSYGSNVFSEMVATFVLVIVIGAMGSKLVLSAGAAAGFGPFLVGILVWAIGLSLGATTGYAINPARDLGPRLAHALLPIAGKGGSDWAYSWVPIIGPVTGAAAAGVVLRVVGA